MTSSGGFPDEALTPDPEQIQAQLDAADEFVRAPDIKRVGELLTALLEAGLASGDNPIIVQDEFGGEFFITDVNHETGDIAIIIESLADRQARADG